MANYSCSGPLRPLFHSTPGRSGGPEPDLDKSAVGNHGRSRPEVADPDQDSAHAIEMGALVGPQLVWGSLHVDDAAFGNSPRGRLGQLAKSIMPIGFIGFSNIR